jgi:hypothetical protein
MHTPTATFFDLEWANRLAICKSLFAVVVMAFAVPAFAEPTLQVVSENQVISIGAGKDRGITFWLQQLMLSALYRNVVQDSSLEEWQRNLSAPTRIHCRYSSLATLAIPERQALSFEEVLLPMPSERFPDYIFIKHGSKVLRLAKYDPWVLYKLDSESGLSRYERLSAVERTSF